MRNLTLGLVVTLALAGGRAAAADGGVIIATSGASFVAGQKDIIRITPPATTGATARPRLTGPAKLVTFDVRNSTDLSSVPSRVEYAIVPTGKGRVTFELISTAAGAQVPAIAARYEFEVK